MNLSTNHHCIVSLSRGPHDGQYLRIDPKVRHLNWQGEIYARIPDEPPHSLVHVRSAVIRIVNETNVNLREEYQKFTQWFFQIPSTEKIKEHIESSGMDRRLIALFNALVGSGAPPLEVFPELKSPK